ncbi:MAG: 2-oxoacid:acceptor oxidoreductase subunit alpha [Thermoproteota archaeon]|jgi:Pyruvate:ferredoxin oxidoreductase and related 2-oxoacid:ferredoxin oxidoreductases, alpha subunit
MTNPIAVRFCGAAGDGIESIGSIMVRTFARSGLHVYAYRNYQSVIRGGHVWYQVRAHNKKLTSFGDYYDIMVTTNKDGIVYDSAQLREGGIIIYDANKVKFDPSEVGKKFIDLNIPLAEIAQLYSRIAAMQNVVAYGAIAYILDLDFNILKEVLEYEFGDKGREIVEQNIAAARKGYEYASEVYKNVRIKIEKGPRRRMFLNGTSAIAFGGYVAGCKFYAAYPMTPSSPILHWFAEHTKKAGMIVLQPEDEIAVINMAIGASFAGVRSMVATSGGGFALMSEAVGLAGMTETPLVIVEGQRGGPSTGLPTNTEQGDVRQVLGAGQSDYPKVVIAPRDIEELFYSTIEAFNLAEKYQIPVIIVSDLYMNESATTLENEFDIENIKIDRGWIVKEGEIKDYKRFLITENGVSPRALPGMKGYNFVAASDEHDEKGHLVSDVLAGLPYMLKIRKAMMEKRMRKEQYILKELEPPTLYGPQNADITIVSWGSTRGAVREALQILENEGIIANSLEIKYLHPFQGKEIKEILEKAKEILLVENNYSGQVGGLIAQHTGIFIKNKLLKYDGMPIMPLEIVNKAKEVLNLKSYEVIR